jgi:hypothetical protein
MDMKDSRKYVLDYADRMGLANAVKAICTAEKWSVSKAVQSIYTNLKNGRGDQLTGDQCTELVRDCFMMEGKEIPGNWLRRR